ncbi:MAG: hypothetical protein ACLGHQ_00810 [Acidimicrobiia bacterium]
MSVPVAGIVVALVRFAFAADRRMFHVIADEPGQLAMARWLAGGTRWNMFDHNTWRPGYSVVLAPVYWLADSGEDVVRAALAVNAVLAGVSAMLLARLVARWTRDWRTVDGRAAIGPWTCAAIATVVALAPAAIASSAYTWAEAMVTCTFLATLWWAQRFVDSGRLTHALVATFVAAVAMTTHGRSLSMLPVVVAIGVVGHAVQKRWTAAAAIVGYGVLLGLASLTFTEWVHDAVWDDPSETNSTGSVIERLDAPAALAESFIGQSWYQLVASLGLVGVGAGVVVASIWRPTGRLDRRSAAVLVALTAPLVLTSVTFMADRPRADQLVYGRYVDAVVWPLAAVGAALVVRLVSDPSVRRRHLPLVLGVAATCGAFGLVVAWRHGDQLADDVGLRMMVPGLLPYIGGADGVPVLRITAIVTLVLLGLAAGLRRRTAPVVPVVVPVLVVLTLALAWAGVRVHDAQARLLNVWAIGDDVTRVDELVPPGERIGVVMVPDAERPLVDYSSQRHRYQVYQLFLDEHEFVWERTPQRISTRYVFAPARTAVLVDAGATVLWGDPDVRMALWELPERTDEPAGRLPSPG